MADTIVMDINGLARPTEADPEMPLLYLLRNELGLKGTRFGCGGEGCGACTVLVDGKPAYSCTLPLLEVAGRPVTTIEHGGNREVAMLKKAFVEEAAGQCGYCLSGIVMTAASLLAAEPCPSRSRIAEVLSRNLCRCGAHPRILAAIERAASALAAQGADYGA